VSAAAMPAPAASTPANAAGPVDLPLLLF
jgi:hypothetical protein